MKYKLLIIEDESSLRKMLTDDLELEGYEVICASDGEEGLKLALEKKVDLVLLDVMMPKMSGWEVCRRIKANKKDLPIIMLTARGQESDKVMGLDLGADDYVTKPFSILELIARIKAILRRTKPEEIKQYKIGNIIIDFEKQEVKKENKIIPLTPIEFEILKILIQNKGKVVSREELLEKVWGYEKEVPTTRTVDNHVFEIRHKLNIKNIETVYGVGYKFLEK
jgi:two-component system alkaline phosphatase synthesis response regulator PhoP